MTDAAPVLARALDTRRRVVLPPGEQRVAAVLVPLLRIDGALHVLYTRRAPALPHHGGEIAFPGGRHDATIDADREATALREAHEEIGVAPHDVRVLGLLDDIATVGSRFVITPVVGVLPHPYAFRPCPREVDSIFTVAVDRLLAPDAERRELWDFGGTRVPIALFPVDGHVIWGATHRITRNLLGVLRGAAS